MTAYDFVGSLENTIDRILNSKDILIVSRPQEILEFAQKEVLYLLRLLDGFDYSRSGSAILNDLDGEIREAVCRFEDVLETYLFNQYNGDYEKCYPILFSPGLQELKEHVDSLAQFVTKLWLVALRKVFRKARRLLTDGESKLKTISLGGSEGNGKTIIAKEIFGDVHISELFDSRVWVTVGRKNKLKEVAVAILAQIHHPQGDFDLNKEGDEEDIVEYLKECLKGRRYLIVLHDIQIEEFQEYWSRGFRPPVWLTTDNLKRVFPDNDNGSRVLLTSSLGIGDQVDFEIIIHNAFVVREIAEEDTNFNQMVKEIFGDTKDLRVSNLLDNVNVISSAADFGVKKSEMVGLSDEVETIKDMLLGGLLSSKLGIVSIVGMAGIGKTTLAKEVFEDPSVLAHFDLRVWVTVGQKYQLELTLEHILSQVNPSFDISKIGRQKNALVGHLREGLKGMKYLIVLDDIWIEKYYHYTNLFPDESNGSRVLLTTSRKREPSIAFNFMVHPKGFLSDEQSWQLLHKKVFREDSCHPELVKPGKKIAKSCEGLPLTIVTVADILSKKEKSLEYWNNVAEKKSSVFKDAYDQMLKVLHRSYECLPLEFKIRFLYVGAFPQTYKIPVSKLFKFWSIEFFNESDYVLKCLEDLDSLSLLMVHRKNYNDQIKTCWLHSAFWHLSTTEAEKNKFAHHLNHFVDGLAEGMKGHRRLCIDNNILFGIKDVRDALASTSTIRYLLCSGPYHQYPVPICFNLILLRILDALTIRFYEFPVEVVKLVHLRYLAVTCNGKLPPSISKLLNLEFLIVHRHLSVKNPRDWEYLPTEIWYMKALKHLQVMGSNLPDPFDTFLLNLLALSDVTVCSCTEVVLKQIPNLKKLGIQIELAPEATEPLGYLNCIFHLCKLESLKCVVVNPELNSEVVALPAPLSMFPSSLKKLSLSGFAYPWEYMTTIASLPNLEVLKLRSYAFRGPEWVTHEGEFKKLKYLLLEDTDLVHWRVDDGSCPVLAHLVIRHCYKLKEIPSESLRHVKKMEIPSISELMEEDEKEKDE